MSLVLLLIIFVYLKPIVIESKQLDLKMKSPVFNKLNQTVNGLIQLRLFADMAQYFRKTQKDITSSFRANIFYWFSTRVLGVTVSIIVSAASLIGIMIGVKQIDNPGDYAAYVVFLLAILDLLQWCFRNVINAESMMVSVARCFRMIDVGHEKPAHTEFDKILFAKGITLYSTNLEHSHLELSRENRNQK